MQKPLRGPDPLLRFGQLIAGSRLGGWFYVKVAPLIDRWLMPLSRGRLSTTMIMPSLMLTTVGAKSGQPRTTPLIFFRDAERIILVASNGGHPNNPAWYYNLRAHPEATVEIKGQSISYVAREAEGEERERLWIAACYFYAGYELYRQRAANRRIPVMVLEPKQG